MQRHQFSSVIELNSYWLILSAWRAIMFDYLFIILSIVFGFAGGFLFGAAWSEIRRTPKCSEWEAWQKVCQQCDKQKERDYGC